MFVTTKVTFWIAILLQWRLLQLFKYAVETRPIVYVVVSLLTVVPRVYVFVYCIKATMSCLCYHLSTCVSPPVVRKLSDGDCDGSLTVDEFTVAMKLVLMRRKNFDIPSSLPHQLQVPPLTKPPTGVNSHTHHLLHTVIIHCVYSCISFDTSFRTNCYCHNYITQLLYMYIPFNALLLPSQNPSAPSTSLLLLPLMLTRNDLRPHPLWWPRPLP